MSTRRSHHRPRRPRGGASNLTPSRTRPPVYQRRPRVQPGSQCRRTEMRLHQRSRRIHPYLRTRAKTRIPQTSRTRRCVLSVESRRVLRLTDVSANPRSPALSSLITPAPKDDHIFRQSRKQTSMIPSFLQACRRGRRDVLFDIRTSLIFLYPPTMSRFAYHSHRASLLCLRHSPIRFSFRLWQKMRGMISGRPGLSALSDIHLPRERLTSLWYYTRNIQHDTKFLVHLQQTISLVQELIPWEVVLIG
jgi:hypothetical protein